MGGIFKTYDIRGVYPNEINENIFHKLGLCLGKLKIKKIAVGRDARLSSDILYESFVKGLIDSGINVINLNRLTSPILSFYCAKNKTFGAMITASHNPKEYNGIKFVDKKGIQLDYDSFLNKIEKNISLDIKKSNKKSSVKSVNIIPDYLKSLKNKFKQNNRELKVIFDCSNGVGSLPLGILKHFNLNFKILNERPDGNFPNHPCDNTKPENLKQLSDEVIKKNADLGIMFDGDADRCAFVDEKGSIVPIDLAFLILALNEVNNFNKTNHKKPSVLFDLRFSRVVSEEILKIEGNPVIMRVGNPFYKKALHNSRISLIAGELSGHIMYKENYSIDDPLFASLKMIKILSDSTLSLSSLVSQYKKYFSSGEISLKVKDTKVILDKIREVYKLEKVLSIDGLTVEKKEVWFNIRPSNTEPLLRVIIEGTKKEIVENQKEELLSLIRENDKD